nr:xylulose kinase-1 [Tanacetum cinerariifolium]
FLNASAIKYALTVNPNIYVSVIKQFWSSVAVKKVNDVTRLQALVDRKKVLITEETVQEALYLDDADSIDCLPNKEIFTELARMGYEKPLTKLTFIRRFSQPYEEYGQFIKVLYVSTIPTTDDKSTSWVGKGFSKVETSLFESMIVAQQADDVADEGDAGVNVDDVPTADVEPTIPSPPPTTQSPPKEQEQPSTSHVISTPPPSPIAPPPSPSQQQQPLQPSLDAEISMDLIQTLLETFIALTRRVENLEQDKISQTLEITKLKQRVKKLERRNKLKASKLRRLKQVGTAQRVETSEDTIMDDVFKQGEIIANMDEDEDVTLKDVAAAKKDTEVKKDVDVQGRPTESQAQIYKIDLEHADKVLSMQDDEPEPAELTEVDDVIEHVKEKGRQYNDVLRYQALKKKPQSEAQARKTMMHYLLNMAGFKMDYFKEEEERRALKRRAESSEEKAAEKQKLDEEVEELRKHLQIIPNDDVYTEATPLALKVPVVDYEIYTE